MFLKKLHRRKNGKGHTYWALVESMRTPKGCRHRTVAYLGELAAGERAGWAKLAQKLDAGLPQWEQRSLFETEGAGEPVPPEVTVRLAGVRVEGTKDFGDVWLGLQLWRLLGLDTLFRHLLPEGREGVRWDLLATVLVLARWCEPSSERHIEQTWYGRTSLPELFGIAPGDVHVERLYRTLDRLWPHKSAVERHLKQRLGELFDVTYDLLLYDVTSTYFEGEASANPQAQRGYSRDKRFDCKQICIGLVVTTDGLPLGYEVFDGNRTDVTTLEEIVEHMERKYGRARRVWVLDRGIVDEDNLAFIRERGGQYLVGTPRSQLRRYECELTEDGGWDSVYEDLEVKLCPSPDGEETFVLCRSRARADKKRAIHERFSCRIEQALVKLGTRLTRTRRAPDRAVIERQIGRLVEKNWRAAAQYQIDVLDDPQRPGHFTLRWSRDEAHSDWARLSEGAYLLRTNLTGRTPQELWQTYMQLVDAEAAFRTLKSELALRPIYHQVQRRVHAHVLVAFLAYALWKTLQKWMDQNGLGRGVRTVVEEFARIKCCEVVLPTRGGDREVQLRCVTRPDPWQRALLQRLGLQLPHRLGQPRWREKLLT